MPGLSAAFGLAAASGLNAYLPLLIVGLLARYTDLIKRYKVSKIVTTLKYWG